MGQRVPGLTPAGMVNGSCAGRGSRVRRGFDFVLDAVGCLDTDITRSRLERANRCGAIRHGRRVACNFSRGGE